QRRTPQRHPPHRQGATPMTSTALNPVTLPASPFYSHGIQVRDAEHLVFVSGQVGMSAEGEILEGVGPQAVQAVANLNAVIGEAGLTPAHITKLTIYLTDPAD